MKTWGMVILSFCLINLSAQDWGNLNRYKNENENLSLPMDGEKRVVFIGNSITEAWPKYDSIFFYKNHYINRGISGQTSPQMLLRFRSDVINLKPKVVIISAGTNDIAENTGPITLEMVLGNIISMVEIAKANDIKVIVASVLPVYDYPWKPGLKPAQKIISLNSMIKNYALEHDVIYLDYYSSMVDKRMGLKDSYTYDGVHPNIEGYNIMKPLVEICIQKSLSQK